MRKTLPDAMRIVARMVQAEVAGHSGSSRYYQKAKKRKGDYTMKRKEVLDTAIQRWNADFIRRVALIYGLMDLEDK